MFSITLIHKQIKITPMHKKEIARLDELWFPQYQTVINENLRHGS